MARDVRELILAKVLELAAVEGVSASGRNVGDVSEDDPMPFVSVYDGTEEVRDDPSGRPSRRPQIVAMEVMVRITTIARAETVGADLNTLRLRIIKALTADGAFAGLSLNGETPRYLGLLSKFVPSRAITGDMALRFSILYALSPSDF